MTKISKSLNRIENKYVTIFLLIIFSFTVNAQTIISNELNWEIKKDEVLKREYLSFNNAVLVNSVDLTPFFTYQSQGRKIKNARIESAIYEDVSKAELPYINYNLVSDRIVVEVKNTFLKKTPYNIITFYPVIQTENGDFKKLTSFDLSILYEENSVNNRAASRSYVLNSEFADGDWYKFGVTQDGVHKITYNQLINAGIPITGVDPRNISLYGNGGGMLPYDNWIERADDIKECAIEIVGEDDGVFDPQDYILFYGEGQNRWNKVGNDFVRSPNIFSDTTYYFVNFGSADGKRIPTESSLTGFTNTVETFDDYALYEFDRVNLIKSGYRWLGEAFEVNTSQSFNFKFENIDLSTPVRVRSRFVASSIGGASSYTLGVGNVSSNFSINPTTGNYAAIAAYENTGFVEGVVSSDAFDVDITFNKAVSSANGWLDYIEVFAKRKLKLGAEQLLFRDTSSVGIGNITEFRIQEGNNTFKIWDVSENENVFDIDYNISGSNIVFGANSDQLRDYVVFNDGQTLEPVFVKKVENQDLHGMATIFPDYLIVTNPLFLSAANNLASFHEEVDGLSSVVVTTEQVFNEFSSGSQDITAIKDFVKMFYDQAGSDTSKFPRYVLLFGDGSYDYKDVKDGNTNYVPAYQSANSFDPIGSYVTDDYIGLLDDSEGDDVNDIVDVGIGRLPVQTIAQANDMVDKIKAYYNQKSMRSWRNWVAFVGDDEDNNLHMAQADDLSDKVRAFNPVMNIDKIYLDTYPQVSGAGGNRYPLAAEALDRRVSNGALMVNYVGHGGELGWSHERVLENSTINAWDNIEGMPLFLTATCEFSRFDDPERTSAGEYVLLNPNGGGIALLTTTRLVFSHLNKSLMDAFYIHGFSQMNSGASTLGDLVMITKQQGPKSVNTRNFSLLGDPALKLAYPKYKIVSTSVPDSVKALSRVTISGAIQDENGIIISDFNGTVYPTVFDKTKTLTTLNNEGVGEFTYDLQKNTLFKGKATVVNGVFQFTFITPKDIDFAYGAGRISYYAQNEVVDAAGFETDFIIGGFDETAEEDNQGPEIELYLNDESFVYGGITDQSPLLIAKFYDENGINTTGNGVGHDIVGVLDENTMESIALNDYYESGLNDFTRGEVQYQLTNLSEGNHKMYLKAWDVYNNSGEGFTEFVVASNSELALEHVLNYPNPFTSNTSFFFEYNQPGNSLDITIQIFTVSGKVVKTINSFSLGDNIRIGPIDWDGKDDYGDNIGKGVYVYKVSVKNDSGERIDKFEKLVLLK